jgi:hypothetical protein
MVRLRPVVIALLAPGVPASDSTFVSGVAEPSSASTNTTAITSQSSANMKHSARRSYGRAARSWTGAYGGRWPDPYQGRTVRTCGPSIQTGRRHEVRNAKRTRRRRSATSRSPAAVTRRS